MAVTQNSRQRECCRGGNAVKADKEEDLFDWWECGSWIVDCGSGKGCRHNGVGQNT